MFTVGVTHRGMGRKENTERLPLLRGKYGRFVNVEKKNQSSVLSRRIAFGKGHSLFGMALLSLVFLFGKVTSLGYYYRV